jgi:hypothetical protein
MGRPAGGVGEARVNNGVNNGRPPDASAQGLAVDSTSSRGIDPVELNAG